MNWKHVTAVTIISVIIVLVTVYLIAAIVQAPIDYTSHSVHLQQNQTVSVSRGTHRG